MVKSWSENADGCLTLVLSPADCQVLTKVVDVRLWPYRILQRDDEGLRADLISITDHFKGKGIDFDMIVFIFIMTTEVNLPDGLEREGINVGAGVHLKVRG